MRIKNGEIKLPGGPILQVISKNNLKYCVFFWILFKNTPFPGRGSALGRRRRRRMGVDFPNVMKNDPNFTDILKMGRLQFSKCLQSWFFKISRFKPRRKSPLKGSTKSMAWLRPRPGRVGGVSSCFPEFANGHVHCTKHLS